MDLEPLEDIGSVLAILYFCTPTYKPTGCTGLPGSPRIFREASAVQHNMLNAEKKIILFLRQYRRNIMKVLGIFIVDFQFPDKATGRKVRIL